MWRDKKPDESSEEEEDSGEEEEDSSDSAGEGPATGAKPTPENMTREQRREVARLKKAKAIARKNAKTAGVGDMPSSSEEEEEEEDDDDDDMPANPNHTSKARSQASKVPVAPTAAAPTSAKGGDDANLSRREREALQAQQAKERYQKLHAEGKTDEAKADLARLKLVKERREVEAAKKQAEKEEREERERDKVNDRETKLRAAAIGGAGPADKKVVKGKGKK